MSLLGSYRKKTSSDGYESLQLVDSHGDSSTRGAAAGTQRVTAGATRSPARHPPHRASTTDSSGSSPGGAVLGPAWVPGPGWERLGCRPRHLIPQGVTSLISLVQGAKKR